MEGLPDRNEDFGTSGDDEAEEKEYQKKKNIITLSEQKYFENEALENENEASENGWTPTEEAGAQDETPEESSTQDEPPEESGTQDEPPEESSTQDEPPEESSTQDEPPEESSTQDEPPEESGTQDEPPEEAGTQDEPPEESSTQDEPVGEAGAQVDLSEEPHTQMSVDKTGYPLSDIFSAVQNCIDLHNLNVLQWTCLHDTVSVVSTLIDKYNEICKSNGRSPLKEKLFVSSLTKQSAYKKRQIHADHVGHTDLPEMNFTAHQLVILDDVSAMKIDKWTKPNVVLVAITSQSHIDLPIQLGGRDDECTYRIYSYDWEHIQNGALAPKPFQHMPVSSRFGSHVHPHTAQCSATRLRETVQASYADKMQLHMILNAMRLPQSERTAVIVQYPDHDMKCSDKIQWLDWIRRHCCVDVRLYGFPPIKAVDEPIEDVNVTCCMRMPHSKIYSRGKNDNMSRIGYNMALFYSMIPPGQHVRLVDVYPTGTISPLVI